MLLIIFLSALVIVIFGWLAVHHMHEAKMAGGVGMLMAKKQWRNKITINDDLDLDGGDNLLHSLQPMQDVSSSVEFDAEMEDARPLITRGWPDSRPHRAG